MISVNTGANNTQSNNDTEKKEINKMHNSIMIIHIYIYMCNNSIH